VSSPHVPRPPRAVARRSGARRASAALLAAFIGITPAAVGYSPALAQKAQSGPVLPGGDSKEPINIDAAKLDYFDKEQKLVYTGDVVARQGEAMLKATALVLFLTPKSKADQAGVPSSASQLRRMEAAGPVTIISKDQIGTGDNGVYEKAQNKVYLTGNVTLTQGANVTKGDKLEYDLTTSQAVVTGRVRSMFTPNSGAEGGGAKTDGAAAPVRKKPAKTTP
jgi:lipopolysaccharide export system protein LptA